ncbi:hypothetical protein AB0D49_25500 [Streptomyces sp. NPDC048290]|uniref:hypothetical protein n=1 Tax=Streptomyces sp. NPDC048290 TaxID=3155811 RepID=UPI003432A817
MPPNTTPLLTYTPSANPARLPIGDPQAEVFIAVRPTDGNAAVYCSQILVSVQVGPGEAGLFIAPPTGFVSTNTWTPTTGPRRSADLQHNPDSSENYASTVIYDSTSGVGHGVPADLTLGLQGAVNNTPGEVTLRIRETSGTAPDPATHTFKETRIMVRKSPADFYVRNFIATTPEDPTKPVTDFTRGGRIRLAWESNGSDYQVSYLNEKYSVGTASFIELKDGLTRDATILLTATRTGPGITTPETRYATLPLTISDPKFARLDVTESLGVKGKATLPTTTTDSLTAVGAVTAGSLSSSTLNTDEIGPKSTQSTMVHRLDTESVKLGTTSNRGGNISLFGEPIAILNENAPAKWRRKYTSQSDGILVMAYRPLEGNAVPQISLYYNRQHYEIVSTGVARTISVPIRANTEWIVDVLIGEKMGAAIWWYPLGASAIGLL